MTHALKTSPEFFKSIQANTKNFELRKMDRAFKTGDKLLLQEFDGEQYTGQEIELYITDVFAGDDAEKMGLKKGFGILSFHGEAKPFIPKQIESNHLPGPITAPDPINDLPFIDTPVVTPPAPNF